MSLSGFFLRFTIIYTLVMAAAGITAGVLGLGQVSALNTPILLAIAYWCFYSYWNKNARIIEGGEQWALIFLALAGDVLASILLGMPTALASDMPVAYLFLGLLVVTPLHLLMFVAVNFVVKKQIIKLHPDWCSASKAASPSQPD
ncbi:hypothetical protein SAMN05216210_0761 [Halopseudomonas salegens]|uniref:Uncharacterized protein n=2 Tax=Halopseudomonas salegens TaxID=1434072 RepID=A0A1H2EIM7_9GAMM|nr:hypothetical protein SAMN05216210_0761 [Halopseudomonas salegens]